jgi:hypothetical protein
MLLKRSKHENRCLVVIRKATDKHPEELAHVACEQKPAGFDRGMDTRLPLAEPIISWRAEPDLKAYSKPPKEHRSRKFMKLFTVLSLAIMVLLFASPALAQTNDQRLMKGQA